MPGDVSIKQAVAHHLALARNANSLVAALDRRIVRLRAPVANNGSPRSDTKHPSAQKTVNAPSSLHPELCLDAWAARKETMPAPEKRRVVPRPPGPEFRFLFPIQPHGTREPLFMFAGGHGSEEEYVVMARLTRWMSRDRPIYGLRVGGHDRLQPLHARAEEMAADMLEEIRAFHPIGPYLFAGECVGGLLAFETARRLEAQGGRCAFIGLMDTACPRRLEPVWHRWRRHWTVVLAERAFVHARRLARVPFGQQPAHLAARVRSAFGRVKQGVAPPPPSRTQMPQDPLDYHYFQTLIRYSPRPIDSPLTLLMSEEYRAPAHARRWRAYARRGVAVVPLAGNHLSYIREHAPEAAARLEACIEDAVQKFATAPAQMSAADVTTVARQKWLEGV